MWFAFTSQMRGTSLLVVTALIFLGEAAGLTQHFRSRSSPELAAGHSFGIPDKQCSRPLVLWSPGPLFSFSPIAHSPFFLQV